MDSENKFWLCIWAGLAVTVLALVLSGLTYNVHQQAVIADLINKGATPIKAYCAITGEESTACLIGGK